MPSPGKRTLEVGCGEGRVTRDLLNRGHDVVAIDSSSTLLRHAREADARAAYVLADAVALPFRDGAFDLVVAYNSLMDIEDMSGAVAEAARVLSLDGRFCICVTHPLADAGRFEDDRSDAPFTIAGSYLASRRIDERFEREGLAITFAGWVHSLETYVRAFEAAGLLIEVLREPQVTAEAVRNDLDERRWDRIPNFLFLRTVKLGR